MAKGGGYRSAGTGRYVSGASGRSNPGTTVREAAGKKRQLGRALPQCQQRALRNNEARQGESRDDRI